MQTTFKCLCRRDTMTNIPPDQNSIIPFGGLAKFDESAVCPYYIAHAA